MSDHISSDRCWPSYKVKSNILTALAPFRLGLRTFSSIPLIRRGWAGRGVGKLLKRKRRIIPKPAPETWTEDGLESTKSRPGFSLSFARWYLCKQDLTELSLTPSVLFTIKATGESGEPGNPRDLWGERGR